MKAAVFHGKEDIRIDEVPNPKIQKPTDAIIKITLSAICGSDLHLYGGFNPTIKKGDILGHEFMGEVIEIGADVKKINVGDKVVIPFTICCGECFYCINDLWSQCDRSNPNRKLSEEMYGFTGAGLYGFSHLYGGISGGQAEFVRVIMADVNAFKVPHTIPDEKVLFLSDIFPTGYMAAENALSGTAISTVAVFGCGPVGQFAIASAFLLGAKRVIAVDKVKERLEMAKNQKAEIIDISEERDIVEKLKKMTDNQGPDAIIDAVGMEADGNSLSTIYDKAKQAAKLETDRPAALRNVIQACRKGGTVSIPGVYSGFIDKFPMGSAFAKNLTVKMGQTHVQKYMQKLLTLIEKREIDPSFVITHRIGLDDVPDAYKLFREKKDGAIKFVINPSL
jgi:threonine dehydrogenase-like Zn-dependent dehydrogenase